MLDEEAEAASIEQDNLLGDQSGETADEDDDDTTHGEESLRNRYPSGMPFINAMSMSPKHVGLSHRYAMAKSVPKSSMAESFGSKWKAPSRQKYIPEELSNTEESLSNGMDVEDAQASASEGLYATYR